MHHADIRRQAAGNTDYRLIKPFRHLRHANRHLAVDALAVDAPFAGDHQRSVFDLLRQPERLGDNFDAASQIRLAEGVQRRAHAARRAAAGNMQHVDIEIALNNRRIVRQRAVQLLHQLRRRAFLRTEDSRRAVAAGQRISHVARHFETALPHARVQSADINFCQPRQRAAAEADLVLLFVQQPRAQRLHHARAAVVGGAAADADNDMPDALVQRALDQLAGAERSGGQGIALRGGHQLQPAGGRHFDKGGACVAGEAVEGVYRRAERSGYAQVDDTPRRRRHHRLNRAFAAVGNRYLHVSGVRKNLAEARFNRGCHA